MKKYKYIIIGGGTTAGYAAKEFVKQKISKGDLCIVSAEGVLPMNRPPLSKNYLKNESKDKGIVINDEDFYKDKGIDVLLETKAEEVIFTEKVVKLENGLNLEYEKLLIATGSKLIHPGLSNENLKNIFYLKKVKHSDQIREKAKEAKNVVIVGGGYIGTETAAVLCEMGLNVTMIVPEKKLLARFATDEINDVFVRKFEEKGVEILFNEKVSGFEGKDKVEKVVLDSGKKLDTDMVVVGAGVKPNVDIFIDTELIIKEGVVVNRYLETNIPDVYAAGDVAVFPDKIFDKFRHVEHWENAFEQGKHAAVVMTGKKEAYDFLPFFFSDVFDYSYEYFGDNERTTDVRYRGDLDKGDFSAWYFDGNRLIATLIMSGRPQKERESAKKWITNQTNIDKDEIPKTTKDLKDIELE